MHSGIREVTNYRWLPPNRTYLLSRLVVKLESKFRCLAYNHVFEDTNSTVSLQTMLDASGSHKFNMAAAKLEIRHISVCG